MLDLMMTLVVPLTLGLVAVYAACRRVDVYDALIQGAGEGLGTLARIIPSLVGLMTAVYMLRASGALDLAAQALAPLLDRVGVPAERSTSAQWASPGPGTRSPPPCALTLPVFWRRPGRSGCVLEADKALTRRVRRHVRALLLWGGQESQGRPVQSDDPVRPVQNGRLMADQDDRGGQLPQGG